MEADHNLNSKSASMLLVSYYTRKFVVAALHVFLLLILEQPGETVKEGLCVSQIQDA